MLEKLKRLWPFVLRIEKEIADNLAATLHNELYFAEAERDAADFNAGRAWKAADELAERLKDADADRVKAIEVGERLGKIAEEAIAERDAARERAAEYDRLARRQGETLIRYAIQISKARLALESTPNRGLSRGHYRHDGGGYPRAGRGASCRQVVGSPRQADSRP